MFTEEYYNTQINKRKKDLQKSRSEMPWVWRLGEVELIRKGMKNLPEGDAHVCLDCGGDYKCVYVVKIQAVCLK